MRFTSVALVVILLLAACLRLGWPALTEFKADEARLLALALDMAEFKSFALRGIGSSVGLPNFPMSVWLYSIPLFIWKHPYSATLFLGALNTLAVYAGYRLTRSYWGEAAALTAALMFAVSPWAVIYSRKIWAQNLLPLFVLAYVGAALAAFVDRKRGFLFLHLVALAVVIQIHLSGLAFIPLTLLLLILCRKQVRWIEVLLGLLAAALTAGPYAFWAAANASPNNQSLITNLLTRPAIISTDSIRFAWLVLCGFDIHSLAGPNAFRDYLDSVLNIDLVRWLWGLAALAGLGIALRRRQPADLIVTLWWVTPILFFARHSTLVFPHYFILTLPAGYVLAGIAVDFLLTAKARSTQSKDANEPLRSWRLRGVFFGLTLVSTALAQAGVWLALLFFIAGRETPGGFGTPLGALLKTAEAAKAAMVDRSLPEILAIGEGDDPAVAEFPAVMAVLLRGGPHRFVSGDESALVPQNGAAVILQNAQLRASGWYEVCARQQGCGLTELERGMRVVTVPPGAVVRVENPFPDPRALANGVELIGWDTTPAWTVIWRVGYVPAAADYHFFNHAPNAQADGVGFPSQYWRDGDVVISFFDLTPSGPVRVGMYEYPALINVPVLDAAGLPYSDAVTAGQE